ncbi:MAG: hypothetical protein KAS59_05625, partial [Alphaproteobacteria bacterium]|nr:hypothetical protein [Alphaproteobacteria bacterium]
FPTGIAVPVGYYDKIQAAWVPSDDGKVIENLSTVTGFAEIDLDGSGIAADAAALSALGITDEERVQLASLYAPGQSLWRSPVEHFTPYDCNFPVVVAAGSEAPELPPTKTDASQNDPNIACGSTIECENQVLGETVGITGTPFTLSYRSNRVIGRNPRYLTIPLSDDSPPSVLKRIELEISLAGRVFKETFPSDPNQSYTFVWDGKDSNGRTLQGKQPVNIRIGYVYDGYYAYPASLTRSFGIATGILVPGPIPARQEIVFWQDQDTLIGGWNALSQKLGAWTLSTHHFYSTTEKILYRGDGRHRSAANMNNIITTVTRTNLETVWGIDLGSDGSLYINTHYGDLIQRVDPNGIITTVAGTGNYGYSGDGGQATNAQIFHSQDIAVAPDGSFYIADSQNYRVRKVDPDGIITTVAGTGVSGYNGDGGPAIGAQLSNPSGVAVGSDGSLYIADAWNNRIRKVCTDGSITTVAGTGAIGYIGDNGPAIEARLHYPGGVAVGPDGSLYIADTYSYRIRKVDPYGIITTVAGNGSRGRSGDGGSATEAEMNRPADIAIDSNSNIYIADTENRYIRKVSPDGIITRIAGGGTDYGSGGSATNVRLYYPYGVAIGPDGSPYIADTFNDCIRRVQLTFKSFDGKDIIISSKDGSQLYTFDSDGRHLRTVNALTGAVLYQFTYNSDGVLVAVEDTDGDITTIERDISGDPTAIVAHDGQRTTLALDPNGYLASITNPANETVHVAYSDDGLLESITDPQGYASQMTYDAEGRLIKDENAAGGFLELARAENDNSFTVTKTSALNRVTTYLVEDLLTGDQRRVITGSDGLLTETLRETNGTRIVTISNGTVTTTVEGPDPRFGMQAPIPKSVNIATLGGLSLTRTQERNVILTDPNDLSTLETLTDVVTVNGRTFTNVFDAAARTFTGTSAEGRQAMVTVDAAGRPVVGQIPGLDSLNIAYDARGRFSSMAQGAGADERLYAVGYNADGYLASVTDPLSRVTGYEYDLAGRIVRETLPDAREILYSYDAGGNLTSVTPPGRPAHTFNYTVVDLTDDYVAPDVGVNRTT